MRYHAYVNKNISSIIQQTQLAFSSVKCLKPHHAECGAQKSMLGQILINKYKAEREEERRGAEREFQTPSEWLFRAE